jgi:NAD(P)-dependent dehydrogenase (short-subunit alcohol dehydrogenase family)
VERVLTRSAFGCNRQKNPVTPALERRMLDITNRTVVITGGATGIGLGLANACGALGARIVIGEPRQERLDEAVAALTEAGITASAFAMDVTDPEQFTAFVDHAFDAFGEVALVVNNAGIGQPLGSVIDTPIGAMQNVMAVNVEAVWRGCQLFGRRLIEQGTPAALYNTGSENSFFVAVSHSAAYVASKHAVLGLTDALREEMPEHVSVGMIAPGFVGSELIPDPMRPMGMPVDEFAGIVLPQMLVGAPYVVSHGYNQVRIDERQQQIASAYSRSAPREEGDDRYDVRTLLASLRDPA